MYLTPSVDKLFQYWPVSCPCSFCLVRSAVTQGCNAIIPSTPIHISWMDSDSLIVKEGRLDLIRFEQLLVFEINNLRDSVIYVFLFSFCMIISRHITYNGIKYLHDVIVRVFCMTISHRNIYSYLEWHETTFMRRLYMFFICMSTSHRNSYWVTG